MLQATPINISINVADIIATEKIRLQVDVDRGNLSAIIERYPVRETPALNEIATKLKFQSQDEYEEAVRKLLMNDTVALEIVKTFFGTLAADIEAV
jgi:hypothetical protein